MAFTRRTRRGSERRPRHLQFQSLEQRMLLADMQLFWDTTGAPPYNGNFHLGTNWRNETPADWVTGTAPQAGDIAIFDRLPPPIQSPPYTITLAGANNPALFALSARNGHVQFNLGNSTLAAGIIDVGSTFANVEGRLEILATPGTNTLHARQYLGVGMRGGIGILELNGRSSNIKVGFEDKRHVFPANPNVPRLNTEIGVRGVGSLIFNDAKGSFYNDVAVGTAEFDADMLVSGRNGDVYIDGNLLLGRGQGLSGVATVQVEERAHLLVEDGIKVNNDAVTFNVISGGRVMANALTIGEKPSHLGGPAAVNVVGTWPTEPPYSEPSRLWVINDPIVVGGAGTGELSVEDGGFVLSAGMTIGQDANGSVFIAGPNSEVNVTYAAHSEFIVGKNADATLEVTNGARLRSNGAIVARNANADVLVDGEGSEWDLQGASFIFGENKKATVTVTNGGKLISDGGIIGANDEAQNSQVILGPGTLWEAFGEVQNPKKIIIHGTFQRMDNGASFNNSRSGQTAGTGTFKALLANAGTVMPGASIGTLTVDDDFTQSASGELQIEVSNTDNDLLVVTGTANLGGVLRLIATEPLDLELGHEISVLTAGNLVGVFNIDTSSAPLANGA